MNIQEIKTDGQICARLLFHSDDMSMRNFVLCLPGDGPSSWRSRTWNTLSERLGAHRLGCLIVDYTTPHEEKHECVVLSQAVQVARNALEETERAIGKRPVAAIASSFGGSVLLSDPRLALGMKAIALKSPASDLAMAYLNQFGASVVRGWAVSSIDGIGAAALRSSIEKNLYCNAIEFSQPVLIIHGKADEIVPVSQSQLLAALLPQPVLLELENCDHAYSESDHWQRMIAEIVKFIVNIQ